ncbi:MAG: hypothetical protein HY755_10455 [Nitrospirae bacterium]|nr:hypothetical protein [Nitrospirota bacterium]
MRVKRKLQGNILILLLLNLFFVSLTLIITANLFADGISIPGSTIPPEQWEKPPAEKPLLPSQIAGIVPDPAKVLHLPPIDMDKLIAEDRAAGDFGKPLRAGIHREINASPLTHGEWFDIPGFGTIWLFEIHAPSASGIDVHFTDFYLPGGAKIYIYILLQNLTNMKALIQEALNYGLELFGMTEPLLNCLYLKQFNMTAQPYYSKLTR